MSSYETLAAYYDELTEDVEYRRRADFVERLMGRSRVPEKTVLDLVRQVRERFPNKDVWCYTGYLYEDLLADRVGEYGRALLEGLDVLVDGPFVEVRKDLTLRFRGSANQRIIDVPASLHSGRVVPWTEIE